MLPACHASCVAIISAAALNSAWLTIGRPFDMSRHCAPPLAAATSMPWSGPSSRTAMKSVKYQHRERRTAADQRKRHFPRREHDRTKQQHHEQQRVVEAKLGRALNDERGARHRHQCGVDLRAPVTRGVRRMAHGCDEDRSVSAGFASLV